MQLITCLMSTVFVQVLVALPFLAHRLGATYGMVGALMGTTFLTYAAGSFFLHHGMPRFGHRRVLWATFPCLAIGGAGLGFMPSLPLLFAMTVFLALMLAAFWVSMECLFSNQAEQGALLRSLSGFCMSCSLGELVGTWLGTALVEVNTRTPFLAASVLVLLCAGVLFWLERSGGLARAYQPPAATEHGHGGERFLPATRTLLFFAGTVMAITFTFVPLVVKKEYAHWEAVSARVIALQPLLQTAVFVLLGRWTRWVHKRWVLWVAPILLIAATALLNVTFHAEVSQMLGSWCLQIALGLVGASMAMAYQVNLLYSLERPGTRARNSGIHEAILGSGTFLGPVLGGIGATLTGNAGGVFGVAVGLALACLLLTQIVWFTRSRASTVNNLVTAGR